MYPKRGLDDMLVKRESNTVLPSLTLCKFYVYPQRLYRYKQNRKNENARFHATR